MRHPELAIEGVLFDLDGTLMDTASDFVSVIHKMQTEDQRPLLDPDTIRSNVSAGSRKLVQLAYDLSPDSPDVESQRNRLLDYYDHQIRQPDRSNPAQLYPGLPALLIDWTKNPSPGASLPTNPNRMRTFWSNKAS